MGPDTFAALTGRPAHTSLWGSPGEVLHVQLARSAHLVIVAPATANVLAKLAHGLSDDLLTASLLEARCPIVLAPAMHSGMWEHPATQANVELLTARGVRFVGPEEGALAHGDEGVGRMSEPERLLAACEEALADRDLEGRRVVVTAGPTHEPIDPVRFIGNRSSGKMGAAIAAELTRRGAEVALILGPSSTPLPPGVRVVHVRTAEEMLDAAVAESRDADAVVMAAAVADFRPKRAADEKLKKAQGPPELVLEPTPDILGAIAGLEGRRVVVGFAAETGDPVEEGRRKLRDKGLDLVVANVVGREGTGFGTDTNEAAILSADERDEALRSWTKAELARALVDRLAELLA